MIKRNQVLLLLVALKHCVHAGVLMSPPVLPPEGGPVDPNVTVDPTGGAGVVPPGPDAGPLGDAGGVGTDPMADPGMGGVDPIMDPGMPDPGMVDMGPDVGMGPAGDPGSVGLGPVGDPGSVGLGPVGDPGSVGTGPMVGPGSVGRGPIDDPGRGLFEKPGDIGPKPPEGPGIGAGAGAGVGPGAGVGAVPGVPGDAVAPPPEPISPEQARRNAECVLKCDVPSCYIAHEIDCRLFIQCDQTANGYHGTEQPCAHGTFWAGANRTLAQMETTCALPKDVQCINDPCTIPENEGGAYSHFNNCKQYWRCEGGISVPKCCPGLERYNRRTGECEFQPLNPCYPEECPLGPDICTTYEYQSEPMHDKHCGTYWACEAGRPVPACCPRGQRYNMLSRSCDADPAIPCMKPCPENYKDGTCKSGKGKYKLEDDRCRTYIQCRYDPTTDTYTSERRCCKSQHEFDIQSNQCVRSRDNAGCDPDCPLNYITDCHLYPVEGDSAAYIIESHDHNTTMPCPPGTLFSMEKCGCGLYIENPPDNSCNLELNIQYHWPKFKNYGSQHMVNVQQMGNAEEGSILNNQATYHFDGNLLFKVDYFKQSLPELFLQVDYLPETPATAEKLILVSNCKQAARPADPVGKPSLEVTLENGYVYFRAQTPSDVIELRVPYKVGIWNQFRALYDKANVVISNQAADAPAPTFETGPLNGAINVAEEGLEIGTCKITGNRKGFIGDIAKVAASKCLTKAQRENLPVPASPDVAPPAQGLPSQLPVAPEFPHPLP